MHSMKLVSNRRDKEIKDAVHIVEKMRTKVIQGGKLSNKEEILLTKKWQQTFSAELGLIKMVVDWLKLNNIN